MSIFAMFLQLLFLSVTTVMPEPTPTDPSPPDSTFIDLSFPTGHDQLLNSPPPLGADDLGGRMFDGDMGYNMTFPGGEVTDAYCQMLLNSPIPPTADQVPWFCICSHCKGTHGPKGDMGERGLPGRPGSPGRRGLTGFRGPPGFTGLQGLKGQKGDGGPKGDLGPEGPLGPKGQGGYKGEKGVAGVEGSSGDVGTKGEEGVCPESCEAVEGPPGRPGLPGSAGPRGLPGPTELAGAGGPKGDPGTLGPTGSAGSPGPQGEAGPEGDCSCEDGGTGPPGMTGVSGMEGPAGSKGEVGGDGTKGDMGDAGMMGAPGPCMPAIQSSFSMGLKASFPPPNMPVSFSQVLSNLQGHYGALTGIYTAPVNGTYVFSYTLAVYGRMLKVGLFHNYLPVVKTTQQHLGLASQQLVLQLARGDEVWLQVKDELSNGMFTSHETSSTFSGFLLHPDSCYMAELRQTIPAAATGGTYSWGELPGPTSPPDTTGSGK
ncbi:hypothetical protein NHX12_009003 [Muraenolepis orangiensis]|uniref:C1q domain-containing protein n=1 Tax=Muraenolepis orangiensis TaxID=630683 RepID=A0A9Q0IBS2_9TELE|nr:hypothetical protein NHX12_009003 [Muraenolepis orangiensis]